MSSIEALWTMQFHNTNGPASSAGVVVFESERIFGGDSCYYYIGNYKVDSMTIRGQVRSVRFNHQQQCQSVIGDYNRLDFQFVGTWMSITTPSKEPYLQMEIRHDRFAQR